MPGTLSRSGRALLTGAGLALVLPWLAHAADSVHRATVAGTELAWVEEGSGTPVVFVHGSGADLRTWGYQMGPFARASFRAVAYSRRFHHPNAPPPAGATYTASLHADDLTGFIESLHAGPVHLVGSSYGGVVALLVARDRPALVRSLALTEPAMLSLLARGSPAAAQAEQLDAGRRLMLAGDADAALHAFIDTIIGPGAYQLMPASTRAMLTDNLPEMRLEAAAPAGDPPFTCEDAGRVKAPVLLLTGGSSPAFFKAIDQRLTECLPSVEAVTVPGASHAIHAQQTARFNELVLEFLQRHRG